MDATKRSPRVRSSTPALDGRTERLLQICSELEPYQNRLAPDDFSDFIESAAYACGFDSLEEACESLIGPELFCIFLKNYTCRSSKRYFTGAHR